MVARGRCIWHAFAYQVSQIALLLWQGRRFLVLSLPVSLPFHLEAANNPTRKFLFRHGGLASLWVLYVGRKLVETRLASIRCRCGATRHHSLVGNVSFLPDNVWEDDIRHESRLVFVRGIRGYVPPNGRCDSAVQRMLGPLHNINHVLNSLNTRSTRC